MLLFEASQGLDAKEKEGSGKKNEAEGIAHKERIFFFGNKCARGPAAANPTSSYRCVIVDALQRTASKEEQKRGKATQR